MTSDRPAATARQKPRSMWRFYPAWVEEEEMYYVFDRETDEEANVSPNGFCRFRDANNAAKWCNANLAPEQPHE